MERASRLIVLVSIALAVAVHAWLVGEPGLAVATAAILAATLLLSFMSLRATLAAVLSTTFVAPTLLGLWFGRLDYHHSIVWLAALAGPLLAHADWRGWSVPVAWRPPLAAWAVIIAFTWPIVAAREVDFGLAAIRSAQATNPLSQAAPRIAAAYVVIFAATQLIGIAWLDFLWSAFRGRWRDAAPWVVVPLLASAFVGAVAAAYQGFVDYNWMNAHIWANMHRAGGFMGDANAFGTGAAFIAPAGVALAWATGRYLPFAVVAYVVLGVGMWAAGSRTALIVFSIGTAALAVAALRQRGLWRPRMARVVTLIGIAVFLLAVAIVPRDFASSNPLERAFARIPRFESAEIERFATELWERFGYGKAADAIVRDHPVAGVGIGAFHVVAPEYIYRDSGRVIPSDNAQNWWRHQLAELGVLGALPALWMSLIAARLCWPRDARHEESTATVLRGALIGLAVISLLGVPTQNFAITIAVATVLFWVGTISPAPAVGRAPSATTRRVLAALVVVVVATTALSAVGDLRVPHRAIRSQVPYAYGLTQPQEMSRFGEVRWMGQRALVVMPASERWLRITVWAPYPDLAQHPVLFELRLNDASVQSRTITSDAPVSLAVEIPAAPMVLLELTASRELMPERALQIAMTWHHDRPDATLPPSHQTPRR